MSSPPLSEPLQNVLLQELRVISARITRIATLSISAVAAIKSAWTRGSPFAAATALYPTTEEGKYIIQAEGIRMAFTNYGGAVTNLWLNNSRGEEIDVVLGLDQARDYEDYPGNPYLNGAIGE
jgi:aldose 1-epimerase